MEIAAGDEIRRSIASITELVSGIVLEMIAKKVFLAIKILQLTLKEVKDGLLKLARIEGSNTDADVLETVIC